ncbi:transmembrane protein, putative (macronuclear) [Tetrahymena thermophila SB210]|uniref:Transmembrane protein, putative n=1 Tax=Tetrahymena thermophila (strain SB210) TaxID=312017 RepID=W7XI58_TETTS|nr:transmembrane protein, putative [Tetrahymena thermophila SB210]EWS73024.1 transmembrane protein, putative [Tetrahymena thermophila SB210]|eukprot:XP_012654421.1 transmembrane protein, putative [Tetrahymena thermophila SB210]
MIIEACLDETTRNSRLNIDQNIARNQFPYELETYDTVYMFQYSIYFYVSIIVRYTLKLLMSLGQSQYELQPKKEKILFKQTIVKKGTSQYQDNLKVNKYLFKENITALHEGKKFYRLPTRIIDSLQLQRLEDRSLKVQLQAQFYTFGNVASIKQAPKLLQKRLTVYYILILSNALSLVLSSL